MQIQDIKLLVENGAIRDATIVEFMGDWIVEFGRHGQPPVVLEAVKSKEVRRFKSLDGAYSQVDRVGIKNAVIKRVQ